MVELKWYGHGFPEQPVDGEELLACLPQQVFSSPVARWERAELDFSI